ncbi:VOC family protein [Hyphococcus sp.]|jgi:catechol 2,3-dioxygenase-like lactoylglutathione lyase family enzyme|uniref:VOC family protein n=1 Tax=Hyphococcus sp. TaxID=2038636 RepID=UPI003D125482
MKRLHLHIRTDDLEGSIRYYTALFGTEPARREPDYAKWLLDDPAANVAVSSRGGEPGLDHVGVSLDDGDGLEAIAGRMREASAPLVQEEKATCCYAKSDKYWSHDPQGTVWELFHSFGDSAVYGVTAPDVVKAKETATGCCAPNV